MSETRKLRIFASYAESNRAWANWVAVRIKGAGHVVTMQHWDSPPGENFVLWVSGQIDAADLFMPLYSREYFKSPWCTKEWTSAMSAGKRMIPLKVGSCELPAILTNITFVDVRKRSEKNINRLISTGLGDPAKNPKSVQASESPEVRSDRVVREWKKASMLATAFGLIGATVIFYPGDPGGSGDEADDFSVDPFS
ncbi:toll/interleukin-1 receptor domain-containing protein [Streptomyces globisporus]|uniref:toll/interleukin-1 receptor domain-containing protein n=1 Tax=Streptomyces globisporus TaxID=1908 RepID=UPI0037017D9F